MPLPKPYNGNEPYIFISYARKDSDIVLPIIEHLQSMGVRLWYDEGIELATANFEKAISDNIEGCCVFVPMLTGRYYESEYCVGEMRLSKKLRKSILPVYLDSTSLPNDLYILFSTYQGIEKYKMQDDVFYQKMINTKIVRLCITATQTKSPTPVLPKDKPEDAEEMYIRGDCYYYGNGVEQNYKKAVECFLKAAEQGHAEAQFKLGLCYYFGWGVEESNEKAAEWYQIAAGQGHAGAQYGLGLCYESGWGVEESYEKAAEWYQIAAGQGHADAQYDLGLCYEMGQGVKQSYDKAAEWYRKAAEQGKESARKRLKELKEQGHI